MIITKDIVEKIASEHEISKAKARRIIDTITEEIRNGVAVGDSVKITGLGTFSSRFKKTRNGYNPAKGSIDVFPERVVPRFVSGKAFKDQLNN